MSAATRLGLAVIGSALVLGILGDALFQGQALGLDVPLWVGAFTLVLALPIRLGGLPWHQGRRWMLAPLLLFSLLFVWHDSELLVAVNLVALVAALAIGSLRRPHRAGVADYAGGLVAAGASAAAGALPVLEQDVRWQEVGGQRLLTVARGVAIGLPLLVVFGGLFAAADNVFESYLAGAAPSFPGTPIRIGLIGAWSWLAAGLLRDLLAERDEARVVSPGRIVARLRRPRIGEAEVLVALGLLDLLFLAFVLVQFRYLFGGRGVVEHRAHLTYAAYARHGFFELVIACALAVPVLLLADWLLVRARALFRVLAGTLVALLFVVIASALQRMRLYEHAYGLTELRLYATAMIVALGVVLVWFAATVLRGRRDLFAVGAVAVGFAATLALNVLDPDALIARTNLGRTKTDVHYVAGLGDDAVPAILRRLPALDPRARRELARALLRRSTARLDWRSWSLSRHRAHSLLERHRAELLAFAGD
jgi:hypothetical protein